MKSKNIEEKKKSTATGDLQDASIGEVIEVKTEVIESRAHLLAFRDRELTFQFLCILKPSIWTMQLRRDIP